MKTPLKFGLPLLAMTVEAIASCRAAGLHDVRAPEPATLNGTLGGAGQASYAIATYVNSHVGTVAYRFPATPVTCAMYGWPMPQGGEPCTPSGAVPGTTLYGVILAMPADHTCRCLR